MKIALLISTNNWPESLDLVMKSAFFQTHLPNEILIADDGFNDYTKKLIKELEQKVSMPIHHIWQKDLGFRKSKILNKAVAKTNSDYIIQVDGDCIMHKNFIEDYVKAS